MEYITLRNDIKMLAVGLGTYPMKPNKITRVVLNCSSTGINLVDTAHDYKNEAWHSIMFHAVNPKFHEEIDCI